MLPLICDTGSAGEHWHSHAALTVAIASENTEGQEKDSNITLYMGWMSYKISSRSLDSSRFSGILGEFVGGGGVQKQVGPSKFVHVFSCW